ncbi:MAG: DNA primase, partial [Muribaculaceae bacterium]|nr:DNA primase [Muribaculaceae bacterium]
MRRIDKETVSRILDTADIVEVVSDFVKLKKRGANYIGLCPFHNERTPSFSVSKSKGICKCFSCGKGGSTVGFVMEHESMTYNEALRYLAAKYNIPIKEDEVTAEELQAETERQSMLAVNEWAMQRFEHNLMHTDAGRDIGFAYFRERGISERMIERFHLGYALEERDILLREATAAGYQEQYLISTGLCYRQESTGRVIDRFRGRVIYPIHSISGKVVAFGGRTLRTDKSVAKYVNSPESSIYSKSVQLYGLYQAKKAISQKGKCILVEGYMDVISMSQSGVENVVASSGTSLTPGQARLLHRFADAVTVIYDSDAAGIKASLRGIDILLNEGLDISIVLLPDGDDPDSFAQHHSSEEVERYIEENSVDFIRFKTTILLKDASNPTRRAEVITDIVQSIAAIPDEVKRMVYIQECSRLLDMGEDILRRQVSLARKRKAEQASVERQREEARKSIADITSANTTPSQTASAPAATSPTPPVTRQGTPSLTDFERAVLLYVVRYGMTTVCDAIDNEGNTVPMSVIDLVELEMANDDMEFSDPSNRDLFSEAQSLREKWPDDLAREKNEAADRRSREIAEGRE